MVLVINSNISFFIQVLTQFSGVQFEGGLFISYMQFLDVTKLKIAFKT